MAESGSSRHEQEPQSGARAADAAYAAQLPPLEKYAALLNQVQSQHGESPAAQAWRRLKRNPAGLAALVFLVLLGAMAVFVPAIPLQSPITQDLVHRQFEAPNSRLARLGLANVREEGREEFVKSLWHQPGFLDRQLIRLRLAVFHDWCIPSLCGTDHLGRDILSRLCWGARVSLTVGILATLVSLLIGVSFGAVAGYCGGWIDMVMMRFVDVMYSIPFIFVVIFLNTFLNNEAVKPKLEQFGLNQLTVFYLVVGAVYWLTMSRVVRGQVISLKHEQFVEGARACGAGTFRIVFGHLVPNCLGVIIVYLTLTIPNIILFESFLSFLGMGVKEPNVSWGILANDTIKAITPVKIFWWLVVFPPSTLALTLLALNILGDGMRDALDPKMKHR